MTFLPIHTGKKIQIDFSRFDIMYSSSTTYGVRAEFAVYSGHDKTGTLLWKLDSHEAASVGPKKILRSNGYHGAFDSSF